MNTIPEFTIACNKRVKLLGKSCINRTDTTGIRVNRKSCITSIHWGRESYGRRDMVTNLNRVEHSSLKFG